MSIICVTKKNGTVCMAADTLTKFGSTKETTKYIKNSGKIIKASDSLIGVVGHASADLALSLFFEENQFTLDTPKSIFKMNLDLHTYLKEKCFMVPREDEDSEFEDFGINFLIANRHGIFGVYSRRSVSEYEKYYAFGSGDNFALGAMYAIYDCENSAKKIAETGARAACEFDDGCSEPIDFEVMECLPS